MNIPTFYFYVAYSRFICMLGGMGGPPQYVDRAPEAITSPRPTRTSLLSCGRVCQPIKVVPYTFGIAGIADYLVSRYHCSFTIPNAIPKFIPYTILYWYRWYRSHPPTQFKYSHY